MRHLFLFLLICIFVCIGCQSSPYRNQLSLNDSTWSAQEQGTMEWLSKKSNLSDQEQIDFEALKSHKEAVEKKKAEEVRKEVEPVVDKPVVNPALDIPAPIVVNDAGTKPVTVEEPKKEEPKKTAYQTLWDKYSAQKYTLHRRGENYLEVEFTLQHLQTEAVTFLFDLNSGRFYPVFDGIMFSPISAATAWDYEKNAIAETFVDGVKIRLQLPKIPLEGRQKHLFFGLANRKNLVQLTAWPASQTEVITEGQYKGMFAAQVGWYVRREQAAQHWHLVSPANPIEGAMVPFSPAPTAEAKFVDSLWYFIRLADFSPSLKNIFVQTGVLKN